MELRTLKPNFGLAGRGPLGLLREVVRLPWVTVGYHRLPLGYRRLTAGLPWGYRNGSAGRPSVECQVSGGRGKSTVLSPKSKREGKNDRTQSDLVGSTRIYSDGKNVSA
jgi:hypothetical protein